MLPDETVLSDNIDYLLPNGSSTWIRAGRYSIKVTATDGAEAIVAAYFYGDESAEKPITEIRLVEPRAD